MILKWALGYMFIIYYIRWCALRLYVEFVLGFLGIAGEPFEFIYSFSTGLPNAYLMFGWDALGR